MQKAIILQKEPDSIMGISADELNAELENGWRVVSVSPFGIAKSPSPEKDNKNECYSWVAAVLVIIERE